MPSDMNVLQCIVSHYARGILPTELYGSSSKWGGPHNQYNDQSLAADKWNADCEY